MQTDAVLPILVQEEDLDSVDLLACAEQGCRDLNVVVVEDACAGSDWLAIDRVLRNLDAAEVKELVLAWHLFDFE